MKFKLCTWERNGYNDSDFYVHYWNDESGQVESMEYATTRFAGGFSLPSNLFSATPEALRDAFRYLVSTLCESLLRLNKLDVDQPNDVKHGESVVLYKNHTSQIKGYEKCDSCGGTGAWKGVRECFRCYGKGYRLSREAYAEKKATGKVKVIERRKLEVGTKAIVLTCTAYGTFYRKGYNKPNRFNRSAMVELEDGTVTRIPLEKLSLDRPYMTSKEAWQSAVRVVNFGNYLASSWVDSNGDYADREMEKMGLTYQDLQNELSPRADQPLAK